MEAKIKKMQEMFTKDLEELKNKQAERNNILEGMPISGMKRRKEIQGSNPVNCINM